MKDLIDLLNIEYYEGTDSQKTPEDNWKIFFGGHKIGQLHNCDGIGGELGAFTETDIFDYACTLCEMDLKNRNYRAPHDGLPNRAPDKLYKGVDGYESEYWFKEMMMYCHVTGKVIPLRYDEEGDIIDFFDFNQGFWIDLGEEVHRAYTAYLDQLSSDEIVNTMESKVRDLVCYLSRHGDDCTEDVLSSCKNYLKRLDDMRNHGK